MSLMVLNEYVRNIPIKSGRDFRFESFIEHLFKISGNRLIKWLTAVSDVS